MAKTFTDPPTARTQEIMDMLASVPVECLQKTVMQLLGATRTVSMGRDREPVAEPDNAVRLRVLEMIVEQTAGAPATRKPIEAVVQQGEERPSPGLLKGGGKGSRKAAP